MKKSNTRSIIIAVIVIVVVLAAAGVGVIFSTRSEKVALNPAGTVGNTAGNINNGGTFCENGGKVYFANAFDNDTLYCMNPDETDIHKISSAVVSNLLSGGNYLYYFQRGESGETGLGSIRAPHSFNRCHTDGSKATSLIREVITSGQLVDNTLYLMGAGDEGPYFFRIGTDGENFEKIADYILNPASADSSYIYYNSTVGNHFLNRLDTTTGFTTVLLEENVWEPAYYGGYIYYMDPGNDYQLRRYNLYDGSIEILTRDKVEFFNVGNGYIYYQRMGGNAGICCMNLDGSGNFVLASGEFTNINMTSRYVYFKDYFEEGTMYHTVPGSGSYEVFAGANMAVGK